MNNGAVYKKLVANSNLELDSITVKDGDDMYEAIQHFDYPILITEGKVYKATVSYQDTSEPIELMAKDVSADLGAAAGSVLALVPADASLHRYFTLYSGVNIVDKSTLEFGDFTSIIFVDDGEKLHAVIEELPSQKEVIDYMEEYHIPVDVLKDLICEKSYEYHVVFDEPELETENNDVSIGELVNNIWVANEDLWNEFDENELYVINQIDSKNKQFILGLNSYDTQGELSKIIFKYEGNFLFGEDTIVKVKTVDGKKYLARATVSSLVSAPINSAGHKMYKFHFNGVRPINLRQSYKHEDGTFFMLADNYYGKIQPGSSITYIDASEEIAKVSSGNSQMELWVGTREDSEDKPFRIYELVVDGTIFFGKNSVNIDANVTFYPNNFGTEATDTTEFFSGSSYSYPVKMKLSSTEKLAETTYIGFHFGNQVSGFLPGTELYIKGV